MYNGILKKADELINKRRVEAEAKNDAARIRLENLSGYSELMKVKESLFEKLWNALANGENTSDIDNAIKITDDKISLLAKENGILTDNYHCGKCKDTGKLENGNYCECYLTLTEQLKSKAWGLSDLPEFTFADHIENINENLNRLYKGMEKYAAQFPDNKIKKLTFIGSVGVGKTCLLSALANAVAKGGNRVMYIGAADLNRLFIEYQMAKIEEKSEVFAPLSMADLLIIDDLGVEPVYNNVTIPYLYQLLEMRKKKHLIVSTNLTVEEIKERYGERIASRLFDVNECRAFILTGDDLRQKRIGRNNSAE